MIFLWILLDFERSDPFNKNTDFSHEIIKKTRCLGKRNKNR